MESVSPDTINRILAVTDAIGIHREAVRVPLAPSAEGSVRLAGAGKLEVVAAQQANLEPFMAQLEARIRALDLSGLPKAE